MGSKIIEIFNKIAYNVLSALYQPFWAAVLLAFLTMFLYLYGKEHGWKKNYLMNLRILDLEKLFGKPQKL